MSVFLDDTIGDGWLSDEYRARYSVAPLFNKVLDKKHINFDTLVRVNRDPFGWCGTRTDLGCKHTRWRA